MFDINVEPFKQYTIPIITEDVSIPEVDETGAVWYDDDKVKIIYQGIGNTNYGDGINLLLIFCPWMNYTDE